MGVLSERGLAADGALAGWPLEADTGGSRGNLGRQVIEQLFGKGGARTGCASKCPSICGRAILDGEDQAICEVQCDHPQDHKRQHYFSCLRTLPRSAIPSDEGNEAEATLEGSPGWQRMQQRPEGPTTMTTWATKEVSAAAAPLVSNRPAPVMAIKQSLR